MTKIGSILTLVFIYVIGVSKAQEIPAKPITIGDTIPDIILQGFINNNGKEIQLSEFRNNKVLIINFWATWCAPCLKELPVLDSLVKANSDIFKVLSVTYEEKETVIQFLKKRKDLKLDNVNIISDDTTFSDYFKHRILPHNIWVDSSGVVRGITGTEGINQENINSLYNEQKISAPFKNDFVEFDMHKTFHQLDSHFIYRSILTGFAKGLPGGTSYRGAWHPTKRRIVRLFTFNSSKAQILWTAINRELSFRDYYGIMEIETNDSTRFFWPSECPVSFENSPYKSQQEWREKNLYCYELTLPFAIQDTAFFDYVLNDVKRAFHVEIFTEKRKIPCSLIKFKGGKKKLESTVRDTSFIEINDREIKARNVSVLELFQTLNEKIKPDLNSKPLDPPFVDKTKIDYPIDIDLVFKDKLVDYQTVKELLRVKYQLEITKKMHEYPLTIVKDLEP